VWWALIWVAGCAGAIYLPDCGLGFLKDDYGWIASSRLDGWASLIRLLQTAPTQFYRPVVSLSFGIDTALFALHPLPYGLTNLGLAVASAVAIGMLVRRLGFESGAALLAASAWLLNFHGIGVAVLWMSGRTSLLATLFAVCAAMAFSTSRPIATGVCTLLALLSKEEPILLPTVFAVWTLVDRSTLKAAVERKKVWALVSAGAVTAVYLVLRWRSGAMTPATAPDYYHYRLSVVPINALHYLDRSLTLTAGLLILGALFVRRDRWHLTALERSTIVKGIVWLVCGFALTIMIPVRSSLYVCLPAVGSALILAAVASAEWRAMERRRPVVIALLLLSLISVPVHWARNRELRNEQLLATNVLRVMSNRLTAGPIRRVVVYDTAAEHPSIADAFGGALPVALRLVIGDKAPADVVVTFEEPGASRSAPDEVEFMLAGMTVVERSPR
jgi:hypothetical protein